MRYLYETYSGKVSRVTEIRDADDNTLHIINDYGIFPKDPKTVYFDERIEALYDNLVAKLRKGTPIKNYRSSKYFHMYLEMLNERNPEYVL
mgnify:CR=1 FL=1